MTIISISSSFFDQSESRMQIFPTNCERGGTSPNNNNRKSRLERLNYNDNDADDDAGEKHTDRQTDKHTDRQTDRQTERQTNRYTDMKTA